MFKNESFRKFAPYFLDKPRTTLEVSRLSKISRRTIAEILESFKKDGEYDSKYVGWYGGSEGLKIKIRLLSDYLSHILGLSQWETDALDKLLAQDSIQKAIVSNNFILDMAIMKALVFTMVATVRNQIEIDDPKYDERTKYFKDALEKAYKSAPPSLMQDIKKLVPKGGIPLPFGLDSVKNDAVEQWLKEYAKGNKKQLEGILVKMRSSTFPILNSPSDLYDNLIARVGGVLYIKRSLEIGNQDWVEQHMRFRTALKTKKRRKQESDTK